MKQESLKNLKPWPKGISGNPAGRKTGSKNVSTLVRELLEQEIDSSLLITEHMTQILGTTSKSYSKAIVTAIIIKAIEGDVRAADWLFEYGYKSSYDDVPSLFNAEKLIVEVVESRESAVD